MADRYTCNESPIGPRYRGTFDRGSYLTGFRAPSQELLMGSDRYAFVRFNDKGQAVYRLQLPGGDDGQHP